MSGSSSYAEYVAQLAANFCNEVKNCAAHKDEIDRFCQAIAPFRMTPCIHISSDGTFSATAISHEGDSSMQALAQAGYEVGNRVERKLQRKGEKAYDVPVSGHGLVFGLYFVTED